MSNYKKRGGWTGWWDDIEDYNKGRYDDDYGVASDDPSYGTTAPRYSGGYGGYGGYDSSWYKPKYDMSISLETRVTQLIKTITGKTLELKQAQGRGNNDKYFFYNPEDLKDATDDEVLGRILHQLAKELFVETPKVDFLKAKEPDYRHLIDVLEDNRADRQLQGTYPGVKYYAEEMWHERKFTDNPIDPANRSLGMTLFIREHFTEDESEMELFLEKVNSGDTEYIAYVKNLMRVEEANMDGKQIDAMEFNFNINAMQNGEEAFNFTKDAVADNFTKALPFIDEYLNSPTIEGTQKAYEEIKKYYPKPTPEEQEQMDAQSSSVQGLSGGEMEQLSKKAERDASRGHGGDDPDVDTKRFPTHGENGKWDEKKEMDIYRQNIAKHQGVVNVLHNLIRSILQDNAIQRFQRPFKRGKLDAKRVYKLLATDNIRIFKKKIEIGRKDYAMTIVADMSGSMYGQNGQYAMEGTIVMAEVLEKLGFPYEIIGYNGSTFMFKRFDQVFNRALIPAIARPNGDNNEVKVVKVMDKHFSAYDPAAVRKKSVFFITDGGSANAAATKRAVTDLEAKHNAVVYGIGIGGMDKRELDENYNKTLHVSKVQDLPNELVALMRGQFRRQG